MRTSIFELWKTNEISTDSCVEWWDSMAENFAEHEIPTSENNLTMQIIEKENMINPASQVLDIGCGAGRFSFAMEKLGADIYGIDISPKMITYAKQYQEKETKTNFFVDNWHNLVLESKGWPKKFDFVLANMTPAITDASTFLKMSEASRNWCLMVKPSRRTNSVYDVLNSIVGAPEDKKSLDETVSYAFMLLWDEGYSPHIEYAKQTWHSKQPLDDAFHQYCKRIETFKVLDDEKRKKINEYLISIATDGCIEETTETQIVAMYWKVT